MRLEGGKELGSFVNHFYKQSCGFVGFSEVVVECLFFNFLSSRETLVIVSGAPAVAVGLYHSTNGGFQVRMILLVQAISRIHFFNSSILIHS